MHPAAQAHQSLGKSTPDAPVQTLTGVQNGTLQCLSEMQSLVDQLTTVLFGDNRPPEDARVEPKHSGNLEMATEVRNRAHVLRDRLGAILSGL